MKAIGAQIRARAQYVEEGEKSTSYFLKLEKHRQMNNKISKLISEDRVIEDVDRILNECRAFYKELYTTAKPNRTNTNI